MFVSAHIGKSQKEDFDILLQHYGELIKNFQNTRILITGATGLLGEELATFFLYVNDVWNANIELVLSARNQGKLFDLYGSVLNAPTVSVIIQDISEKFHVSRGVDFIFHTAATTNSKQLIDYPVDNYVNQFRGMVNILDVAREKHSVLVYLSSMEIYGQPFINGRAEEDNLGYVNPLVVRSGYPESKRSNEFLSAAYAAEYGVNVVNARLAQTFGAGTPVNDTRAFAQFARSAITDKDIVLHTDGTSNGNYTYLSDTIAGLLVLAVRGKKGNSYNIVNENSSMTIRQMAQLVADKFGNGNVVVQIPDTDLGYAPKVTLKLSSKKIERLGWRPTVELEEMFSRMISGWRDIERNK